MTDFLVARDALLNAAVAHTANLKGKARDTALFDFLCGAAHAQCVAGEIDTVCPPWLWVIGVRGGSRLAEIERMLHADEKVAK